MESKKSVIKEKRTPIRRARLAASCIPCRVRKIKCDRLKPCSRCVKVGRGQSCEYEVFRWNNTSIKTEDTVQNPIELDSTDLKSVSGVGDVKRNVVETVPLSELRIGSEFKTESIEPVDSNSLYCDLLKKEISQLQTKLQNMEQLSQSLTRASQNPFISDTDTICLYDGLTPLPSAQGLVSNLNPYSWKTIVLKDKFIRMNWYALMKSQEKREEQKAKDIVDNFIYSGSEWMHSPNNEGDVNTDKNLRTRTTCLLASQELSMESTIEYYHKKQDLLQNSKLITDPYLLQAHLKNYVLSVLPTSKVLWLSIERFFRYCYLVMPYLDEGSFLREVNRIIGPMDMTEGARISSLTITREEDFAVVTTLLLVIALGNLSLAGLNKSILDEDEKYLMQRPIGQEVADAAHLCLLDMQVFSRSCIPVFQCTLFLRLYERSSYENGDFVESGSQVLNGMVVQMALSLGLNRDPSTLVVDYEGVSLNLRRKLFYGVKLIDNFHNFILGSSSSGLIDFYNTRKPEMPTQRDKNHRSLKLDKLAWGHLIDEIELEELTSNLLGQTLSINKKYQLGELNEAVDKIIERAEREFKSISEICSVEPVGKLSNRWIDHFKRLSRLECYMKLKSVCYVIWFHLFLHYETRGNHDACFHYFEKLIHFNSEFLDNFPNLIEHSNELMGKGFQFSLVPLCQFVLHRCCITLSSFVMRILHLHANALLHNRLTPALLSTLSDSFSILFSRVTRHLNPLNTLAQKYFYSWRVGKIQLVICALISSDFNTGELCLEPYYDKATGEGSLRLRTDVGVFPAPESSFMSDYGEERAHMLYNAIKKAYDTSGTKQFVPNWGSEEGKKTPSIRDISPESVWLLTSTEIDRRWSNRLVGKKIDLDHIAFKKEFTTSNTVTGKEGEADTMPAIEADSFLSSELKNQLSQTQEGFGDNIWSSIIPEVDGFAFEWDSNLFSDGRE